MPGRGSLAAWHASHRGDASEPSGRAMLGSVQLRRAALAVVDVRPGIRASRPACSARRPVVLVAGPQPALAAGCTRPAPSATAHGASLDALRSPAWTAADLTGSVPLTDGRRLWLYGDTITSGLEPVRRRRVAGVHGPQLGDRPATRVPHAAAPGQRRRRPGRGSPSWAPSGTGRATATPVAARSGCTPRRLAQIGTGVFGFQARAVDLVEVDQATLTIRRVHRNRYAAAPVLLGSSVTTDGTWTYVYGRDELGTKRNTYVARVAAADPLTTTAYWTGATWSTNVGQARPIFTTDVVGGPSFADLGPAYGGKRFVAAVKDGEFLAGAVEVYTAPGPAGPWFKATSVPAPGLASDTSTWTYLAASTASTPPPAGCTSAGTSTASTGASVRARRPRLHGGPSRLPVNLRMPAGAPAVPTASAVGRGEWPDPGHPGAAGRHADRPGWLVPARRRTMVAIADRGPGRRACRGDRRSSPTFTVVDPRLSGFLTVWPCGRAMPVASSLNYLAVEVVPNTITRRSAPGAPSASTRSTTSTWSSTSPHRSALAGTASRAWRPTRLLDTRRGSAAAGCRPGAARRHASAGRAGVPAGAVAAAVNLTATEASRAGYVTAWPCDRLGRWPRW